MGHSQRYAETWEEIIRLARQTPNSDAVVFIPNIPERQKRRYINMPDGTIETRRYSKKKATCKIAVQVV
jgi:hypothetical protein